MKIYRICFIARKKGTSRDYSTMIEFVEAETPENAVDKLYKKYDMYVYPLKGCIKDTGEKK